MYKHPTVEPSYEQRHLGSGPHWKIPVAEWPTVLHRTDQGEPLRQVALGPAHNWVFAERGETYRELGDYERALEDFNRAIELNPEDAWTLALRARIYKLLKKQNLADIDFKEAKVRSEQ